MIRVLNQKDEEKVYTTYCYECEAELEYHESDTDVGEYGIRYIVCPVCNSKILVGDPDAMELDEHNIEFPRHFEKNNSIYNIDDKQIQNWVRECLKRVKEDSDDTSFTLTGTGDTMVFAFKFYDEYAVYVAKNYLDCSIMRNVNEL